MRCPVRTVASSSYRRYGATQLHAWAVHNEAAPCSTGTLYSILGVTSTASQHEIRVAYKQQVHSLHPDKHLQKQVDTTAAFIRCKLAYEILIDARKRREYDQQHLSGQQQKSPAQEEISVVSPQHSRQPPDPTVASAAVAAAAGSSSFTQYTPGATAAGTRVRPSSDHAPPAAGAPNCRVSPSSAVRICLMTHHNVVLEQFQSLQEALEFLQQLEQQQELLGLAADDYAVQDGSLLDTQATHGTDAGDAAQRWGGFHPGEYAPIRHQ